MSDILSGWEQAANVEEQKRALDDTFNKGWYKGIVRQFTPRDAPEWSTYKGEQIGQVQLTLNIPGTDGVERQRVLSFDVAFEKRHRDNGSIAMEYLNWSKLAKGTGMLGMSPKDVFAKLQESPYEYHIGRREVKRDGEATGEFRNDFYDVRPLS